MKEKVNKYCPRCKEIMRQKHFESLRALSREELLKITMAYYDNINDGMVKL